MKKRLDELLVQLGHASSIKESLSIILAGNVFVNEARADKPGALFLETCTIRVKKTNKYVSRGGLKLEKGLSAFKIDVSGWTCIDIGASTGGFTDCLLQHGAKHVYAIDVAYGQFSWKLRNDKRVTLFERFNAKKISTQEIPDQVDLAVMDASFISTVKLIPPLLRLFGDQKRLLILIKPQFELPKQEVGPGGVVTAPSLHSKAVGKVQEFVTKKLDLTFKGVTQSPICGPKGNIEFIAFITE